MAVVSKEIGIIGVGSMGGNIAERLHGNGYSLVLYNNEKERYERFKGRDKVYLSSDLKDFANRLRASPASSTVWIMVPGGEVTNALVAELSGLLRSGDTVIDGSNSKYPDSISNYNRLKSRGISYLDVGCAGGPGDLLEGVSLMVGGDRPAFESAREVFRVVSGSGTYGYVGESGSGQMTKLIHNGIFYGIFPVYAEGIELLQKASEQKDFDMPEALRLLSASPPITTGIMQAISSAMNDGKLPNPAPEIKISSMVNWEAEHAKQMGVSLSITRAILAGYATMSDKSKKIYAAAKEILTGH